MILIVDTLEERGERRLNSARNLDDLMNWLKSKVFVGEKKCFCFVTSDVK